MSIRLVNYSEKAIAVYGDTKDHKERLLKLGGKFNQNLKEGPGWIFSKKNEASVKQYVDSTSSMSSMSFTSSQPKSREKVSVPAPSSENGNIKDIIAKIPPEKRLAFIAEVTKLALEIPYKSAQVTVSEEDSDVEDDDPSVPMPRML